MGCTVYKFTSRDAVLSLCFGVFFVSVAIVQEILTYIFLVENRLSSLSNEKTWSCQKDLNKKRERGKKSYLSSQLCIQQALGTFTHWRLIYWNFCSISIFWTVLLTKWQGCLWRGPPAPFSAQYKTRMFSYKLNAVLFINFTDNFQPTFIFDSHSNTGQSASFVSLTGHGYFCF